MKPIIDALKKVPSLKLLWLNLFLIKFILSLLIIFPIFITINSSLSQSVFSKTILKSWDISVIVELIIDRGMSLLPLGVSIISGLIIYILIVQFINGGLYYLTVSGRSDKIDWGLFFLECGRNFGTHLRITLFMTVIYLLLLPASLIFAGIISGIISSAIVVIIFRGLIFLLVLMTASIFSDSVRCALTVNPDQPIKEIFSTAAKFYRPRMPKLVVYFIATYLPFIVIWLLVEFSALHITAGLGGLIGLILEFLLFQISSLMRTIQKIWYLLIAGKMFRDFEPGRFSVSQTELNFDR